MADTPPLFMPDGYLHVVGLLPDAARLDSYFHEQESARPERDTRSLRSGALLREELHYTLSSSWFAVEMVAANGMVVASRMSKQIPPGGLQTLGPERTVPFSAGVDLYLSSMRRGQNCLVGYAGRAIKQKNLPSSASDWVKKLRKDSKGIDDALTAILLRYWQEHGARLRAYRDLSQHKAVVTSDFQIGRSREGELRSFCCLPSNPEEPDPKKLRYDPAVQILDYMLSSFVSHVRFAREFTLRLVEIVRERDPSAALGKTIMSMEFKAGLPFTPGDEYGGKLVDQRTLREQLVNSLR